MSVSEVPTLVCRCGPERIHAGPFMMEVHKAGCDVETLRRNLLAEAVFVTTPIHYEQPPEERKG